MPLFSPQHLKRFERLSFYAQQTGGSPLLAVTRKRLPGGGTEVTGHRDYSPGDDFHAIDWMLCARRDELYVKLFEGQADRDIHILLDCSPSMGLGRPAKFQIARQVAAALGYVSLLRLDRLTVAAYADGLVAGLPPLRHESRALRLLRFLEGLSASAGVPALAGSGDTCRRPSLRDGARAELQRATNLLRAVEAFVRRPQRPGPVVVISDLYDAHGFQRGFDLLRFHGYDPRLVEIVDPADADAPLLGDVELVDVESQGATRATITERTARRYRQLVAEFHDSVRDSCRRMGIFHISLACDTPEDEVYRRVMGCHSTASGRMDLRVRSGTSVTDSDVHLTSGEAAAS
jgi:uncharacterized protein (DUF58 family)